MYQPAYTHQLAKDIKLAEKRGKDLQKLRAVMTHLLHGQALPLKTETMR
jgi:mRNA-degrading endonuclease YafQ of YafQ-DinJ toxin-antitoxin module